MSKMLFFALQKSPFFDAKSSAAAKKGRNRGLRKNAKTLF
jgi:hypothetical protein